MAITSVAGATFTRSPVGPTSTTGWAKVQCSAYLKTTALAERTLVAFGTALVIGTDALNRLTLTLDGTLVAVGITPVPLHAWVWWGYRKFIASGVVTHTVKMTLSACVNNAAGLATPTTEILSNVVVTTTGPNTVTLHVPAGCSVVNFKVATSAFGGSAGGLDSVRAQWQPSGSETSYTWRAPLRFPNDCYDHREISGANGDFFVDLHDWTSRTGTVTLDAADPGVLTGKLCSAFLGLSPRYVPPSLWEHDPISAPSPAVSVQQPTGGLSSFIRQDCLPDGAEINRIAIGCTADLLDPNQAPLGVLTPAIYAVWTWDGGGPTEVAPFSVHFTYYDWIHLSVPTGFEAFGPSALYSADVDIKAYWGPLTGTGPLTDCATYRLHEIGVSVLYLGPQAGCDVVIEPPAEETVPPGSLRFDGYPLGFPLLISQAVETVRRPWLRRATHLSREDRLESHHAFELDVEVGVGNVDAPDPTVTLRWSDDGGHTWSHHHTRTLGTSSQTAKRVRWQRLGRPRDRVYEVSGSDPVKIALIDAYLSTSPGIH